MNSRSIEKILGAASRCKPQDDREAALIGAMAQVLISTGHFRPHAVAAYAAENMAEMFVVARDAGRSIIEQGFAGPMDVAPLEQRMFPQERRGYPTMAEIKVAAEKFRDEYNPPALAAA